MTPALIAVLSFCSTVQTLITPLPPKTVPKLELLNESIRSMRSAAQKTKSKIDRALATFQQRGLPISDPGVQLLIRLQNTYQSTIDSLQGVEAGKKSNLSPWTNKRIESVPKPEK